MNHAFIRHGWLPMLLLAAGCLKVRDDVKTGTDAKLTSSASSLESAFVAIPFEEALSKAKTENKVVMVDFYTEWCGPCKQLDATTWKDPAVVTWLNEKTIPLKIDAEKERELAAKYKIDRFPTMIFIKADGSEIGRVLGYRKPGEFQEEADQVLAGIATAQ